MNNKVHILSSIWNCALFLGHPLLKKTTNQNNSFLFDVLKVLIHNLVYHKNSLRNVAP